MYDKIKTTRSQYSEKAVMLNQSEAAAFLKNLHFESATP